jgi:hypothetical protein
MSTLLDFALDPITVVYGLASIGIIYERYDVVISILKSDLNTLCTQPEKRTINQLKDVANTPSNLAIVPIHVRDSVRWI